MRDNQLCISMSISIFGQYSFMENRTKNRVKISKKNTLKSKLFLGEWVNIHCFRTRTDFDSNHFAQCSVAHKGNDTSTGTCTICVEAIGSSKQMLHEIVFCHSIASFSVLLCCLFVLFERMRIGASGFVPIIILKLHAYFHGGLGTGAGTMCWREHCVDARNHFKLPSVVPSGTVCASTRILN